MNTSTEVDEQQREKAAHEQVMINELKEAPVIHEWSTMAEPHAPFKIMAAFSGVVFIISGVALALRYQSLTPIFICSLIGFSLASFVRYLWMADKHYHYQWSYPQKVDAV